MPKFKTHPNKNEQLGQYLMFELIADVANILERHGEIEWVSDRFDATCSNKTSVELSQIRIKPLNLPGVTC